MKVLILGIDALEFDLVKKYNLKNLKQKEFGKVICPLDNGAPNTPSVWATFLTGKRQKMKFKKKSPVKWGGIQTKLVNFYEKTAKKLNFYPHLGIRPRLAGVLDRYLVFPKLNQRTFLEDCHSDYCCVPFYDFDKKNPDALLQRTKFLNKKISYVKYKEFLEKYFQRNKKVISEKLRKSKADLFFCYFLYLDQLQHHFYKDEELIRKAYKEFDEFTLKLRRMAKPGLFIVISDHGQKNGSHTNYGFYSLNKKLNLGKPKTTDFYDVIMDCLKLPRREEQRKIEKHLKKMGYF